MIQSLPAATTAKARSGGRCSRHWFWIDPVNELIMIGMIQQMGGTGATAVAGMPDVRGLSRIWTYQSFVE